MCWSGLSCPSTDKTCWNLQVRPENVTFHPNLRCGYVRDASFDWDPLKNTFAKDTGNPGWLVREGGYRGGWDVKA